MSETKTEEPKGELTDRFGAVASSLCALHCALCALAPSLFGALGLGLLLSPAVENGLALIAILFALGAMALAWRQHRSNSVLTLLALGIIGLVAARSLEMGGHHDHHDEGHHTAVGHDDEHETTADDNEHGEEHHDEHGDEHHDEHGEEHHDEHGEEGIMHSLGAGVGVLAGLMLFGGHLLNLQATRKRREDECCD